MQKERPPRASLRAQLGSQSNDPEQVEAAIKDTLAALADIETRFEIECLGLDRSVVPRALKAFFLCQTRLRRRLRRVPHELALRDLHLKLLRQAQLRDRTLH
jgi:hypothetical protein